MDILRLHAAYADGTLTPVDEVERFLRDSDEPQWAAAWIHRADAAALRVHARGLTDVLQADAAVLRRQPLFGVLFAVKDNIDVAGMPTTAACPDFRHVAGTSAEVVRKLEEAGALCVGKTNLDQFATGLVGTRSPYGDVPNALVPERISGGSSSGSAVAVARGWVSFALGTDTAGSGRVPAALNNIVGLKPSRGLLSARGVLPACQSLDCVSILALTVDDAVRVFEAARGYDAGDPYGRQLPLAPDCWPTAFRFGVPAPAQLEFFGDTQAAEAFEQAVARLRAIGGAPVAMDFDVFTQAAALLYEGPWVAERLAAIRPFFETRPGSVHPVVARIIDGARAFDAAQLFAAATRLEHLRKQARALLEAVDVLVVPSAPNAPTRAQVLIEPFVTNRRMGQYTNFVNLLDLAALAVPVSRRGDGVPAGVTLIQRAGADLALARLGERLHHASGLTLGATSATLPPPRSWTTQTDSVDIVVVGAHLSGQPLNAQLTERGARLVRSTRTAPRYRLYALAGSVPPKPGMVRVDAEEGHAIEVEVWRMPLAAYGSFVALIPAPLGIGRVELEEGGWLQGFLCESHGLRDAVDITHYGGWRAYRAAA